MKLVDKVLNPYFGVSFVTFLIAFAAAVLFPLGQMFMNPKAAIKTGISLAVLGVIYLISWSLASDNNVGKYFTENHITPAQSQFIGSLIYIAYILGALAFLSIIVSGVLGMLSKR
jgi:drug/metabolite transporter (DMT)-like permease